MNKNPLLVIIGSALGFASMAVAGESSAPTCNGSADSFKQWNFEASYLHMIADGSPGYDNYSNQDFEDAYRLSLSYQPSYDAIGYRLNWTEFEGTYPTGVAEKGPTIDTIDIEAFKNSSYKDLGISYSLGVRYIDVFEQYSGSADVSYEGFGPMVGVDLTYPLVCGLSAYADARIAYIYGDDKARQVGDDKWLQQYGIGLQYNLCALGLSDAYLKAGYEIQRYEEIAYGGSDADVQGFVLALGYSF